MSFSLLFYFWSHRNLTLIQPCVCCAIVRTLLEVIATLDTATQPCMYIYIYIYVCVYICIYICMCIYIYVYICMCICMYQCVLCEFAGMPLPIYRRLKSNLHLVELRLVCSMIPSEWHLAHVFHHPFCIRLLLY